MLMEVLKDSENSNIGPWIKFGEIGSFSPCSFRIWQIWSSKQNLKKKANVILHHSEYYNFYPRKNVWIYYRFGPSIFHNYKIGPCFTTTTNPKCIQPDPQPNSPILITTPQPTNPCPKPQPISTINIYPAQHHFTRPNPPFITV